MVGTAGEFKGSLFAKELGGKRARRGNRVARENYGRVSVEKEGGQRDAFIRDRTSQKKGKRGNPLLCYVTQESVCENGSPGTGIRKNQWKFIREGGGARANPGKPAKKVFVRVGAPPKTRNRKGKKKVEKTLSSPTKVHS